MTDNKGYTLAELIVCLAITGTTLGVALAPFKSTLERGQQAEATNLLLGALHYARGSAVLGRTMIGLCAGSENCSNSLNWQSDLLVFNDRNKNGQIDPNETLLKKIATPPGYSWRWSNFRSASYLQYETDGTTRALNGTFTLCRDNQPRSQVVINLTGRVRTQPPSAAARCN